MIQNVDGACSVCNTTTSFTCLSKTQYATCNSTSVDLTTLGECPSPSVCNESMPLNLPFVKIPCFVNATGSNVTTETSCKRPLQTYVTNSAAFSASTYCSTRRVGLYVHPTIHDCISYVRCFKNNTIIGSVYKCPGTSRFNNVTYQCDGTTTC